MRGKLGQASGIGVGMAKKGGEAHKGIDWVCGSREREIMKKGKAWGQKWNKTLVI